MTKKELLKDIITEFVRKEQLYSGEVQEFRDKITHFTNLTDSSLRLIGRKETLLFVFKRFLNQPVLGHLVEIYDDIQNYLLNNGNAFTAESIEKGKKEAYSEFLRDYRKDYEDIKNLISKNHTDES